MADVTKILSQMREAGELVDSIHRVIAPAISAQRALEARLAVLSVPPPQSPEAARLELLLDATRANTAVVESHTQLLAAQGKLLQTTVHALESVVNEQQSTTRWMIIIGAVTIPVVAASLILSAIALVV